MENILLLLLVIFILDTCSLGDSPHGSAAASPLLFMAGRWEEFFVFSSFLSSVSSVFPQLNLYL